MKYFKMLSLLAVAVAGMLALIGTASAVNTTAPAGTKYTGTTHSVSEQQKVVIRGPSSSVLKCESTTHSQQTETKSNGETETILDHFVFTHCEGGTVDNASTKPGTVIAHSLGSGNGAITSVGAEFTTTVNSIFGTITCVYATGSGTKIGTLTGASSSTGHATLHVAATIPRTGGSGLCGSTAEMSGSYKVNTPTGLKIT